MARVAHSENALASTTVKVSRDTLVELEKLREELKARSLDEAITTLIRRHRMDFFKRD